MKIKKGSIRRIIREELARIAEVAPPGREDQVKSLKGKVDNPYAVAWSQHNKHGKPKNEIEETDEIKPSSAQDRAPSKWWEETSSTLRRQASDLDDDKLKGILSDLWDNRLDDESRAEIRKKYGEK